MAVPTATAVASATAGLALRGAHAAAPSISIPPVHISVHVPTITPFHYTPTHRTDCVTMTPNTDGYVPPSACNALWQYSPSMAAAVLFSTIFGMLLVAHITQAVIFKKKFCAVIIMSTAWQFGSYVTRSIAVHNQQSSGLALVSQALVLLAPLWLNAFVYMVFARAIYFVLPTHRLHGIHASKVAFVFVWLDVISFIIQLIGSFQATPGAPTDQIQTGLHIYMGGIGIQELWILVVLGLAGSLWVEIRRVEQSPEGLRSAHQRGWRKMMMVLYATLILITVRVIFRLVEFSNGVGSQNPLPTHEAYFYVFDAVPMAAATLLVCIGHPGFFFKGPYSEFPSLKRAERNEVKCTVKAASAEAKARGVGWWDRYRLRHQVKRSETERIAEAKWNGLARGPEKLDGEDVMA